MPSSSASYSDSGTKRNDDNAASEGRRPLHMDNGIDVDVDGAVTEGGDGRSDDRESAASSNGQNDKTDSPDLRPCPRRRTISTVPSSAASAASFLFSSAAAAATRKKKEEKNMKKRRRRRICFHCCCPSSYCSCCSTTTLISASTVILVVVLFLFLLITTTKPAVTSFFRLDKETMSSPVPSSSSSPSPTSIRRSEENNSPSAPPSSLPARTINDTTNAVGLTNTPRTRTKTRTRKYITRYYSRYRTDRIGANLMSFLYGSFIAFEQNYKKKKKKKNDSRGDDGDGVDRINATTTTAETTENYYEYGGYCIYSLSCPWKDKNEGGLPRGGECQLKRGWLQRRQSALRKTNNMIQSLLKLTGLSTLIPMGCPSSSSVNNYTTTTGGGVTATVVNEVFIDKSFDIDTIQRQRPLSGQFLSYLKQSIVKGTSTNQNARPQNSPTPMKKSMKKKKITAHIRRGDVDLCTNPEGRWFRYLPNKYFLALIDEYITTMTMTMMDDAAPETGRSNKSNSSSNSQFEVIIHSEWDSLESFDLFTERGFDVKLDDDPRNVWSDILSSNIIITSPSLFSVVPSVLANALSNATVVYHPMHVAPLETFRVIERGSQLFRASYQEKIRLNSTFCPSFIKQQQEQEGQK